jgi:hypothetical protein
VEAISLMERVAALEQQVKDMSGGMIVPPGHRLVFWTRGNISRDMVDRLSDHFKQFGIEATFVGNCDGVAAIPKDVA